MAKNHGGYDSIDETTIRGDVYTIFSNKAGHGGKGTIIAFVKGTKAESCVQDTEEDTPCGA